VDPSQQLAYEFNLRTKPPTSELDIKDLAMVGGASLFVVYSMVARWLTMCRARSTISPQRSRILGCHWSWLTRQSASRVNFPPMKSSELPRPEACVERFAPSVPWAYSRPMRFPHKLLWAYALAACATLVFQIWWRSFECGDACGLSYAKAVVWSIIWPLSWVVFLKGFL